MVSYQYGFEARRGQETYADIHNKQKIQTKKNIVWDIHVVSQGKIVGRENKYKKTKQETEVIRIWSEYKTKSIKNLYKKKTQPTICLIHHVKLCQGSANDKTKRK